MKPERTIRLLVGVALPVQYELLPDGSGVGMRKRRNRLKGWSER